MMCVGLLRLLLGSSDGLRLPVRGVADEDVVLIRLHCLHAIGESLPGHHFLAVDEPLSKNTLFTPLYTWI